MIAAGFLLILAVLYLIGLASSTVDTDTSAGGFWVLSLAVVMLVSFGPELEQQIVAKVRENSATSQLSTNTALIRKALGDVETPYAIGDCVRFVRDGDVRAERSSCPGQGEVWNVTNHNAREVWNVTNSYGVSECNARRSHSGDLAYGILVLLEEIVDWRSWSNETLVTWAVDNDMRVRSGSGEAPRVDLPYGVVGRQTLCVAVTADTDIYGGHWGIGPVENDDCLKTTAKGALIRRVPCTAAHDVVVTAVGSAADTDIYSGHWGCRGRKYYRSVDGSPGVLCIRE